MVDKQRVQLLIDALRSGEFTQGSGALRLIYADTGENAKAHYCCLGVATVVAYRNGLDPTPQEQVLSTYQALPQDVIDWYGFDDENPRLYDEDEVPGRCVEAECDGECDGGHHEDGVNAIYANDDLSWDFNRIADGFEYRYIRDRQA